jgi:hypothetical protein
VIIGKILVLLCKGKVRRSKGLPLCFIGKHQEQLVSAICIGREITSLINGNPLFTHGGMALVLTGVIRMKQRGTIMRSVGEELEEV